MTKSNLLKRILPFLLIVAAFSAGVGIYAWVRADRNSHLEGKLQVHVLDVGQGDAALLILPTGERLLIDTGTADSAEDILAHLARYEVKAIDLVILSHNHSDHAGGLKTLADAIPIGGILYCGEPLADSLLMQRELAAGDAFAIGDVKFSVIGPLTQEDTENRSMILRIDYGMRSFLFTGDAEADEEALLLNTSPALLDVDFLKVGHHGSASSSTEVFLGAVSPQVAVISASADNSYGHPSPQTIDRLEAMNCIVYRTDKEGTMVFLCDGETLTRYLPGIGA